MTLFPILTLLCATPVSGQNWPVVDPVVEPPPRQHKTAITVPVPQTPPPAKFKSEAAKEHYEEKYIGFADVQIFDANTGHVLDKWIAPYQGKFHKPLEPLHFFELVGRPDLVHTYRKRNRVRLSIGLGGAGLMLGGGGLIAWGLIGNCTKVDVAKDQCLAHDSRPLIAGGVLVGTGLAALLVASIIDPNPVDGPTERELADTYNKRLQRELGAQESSRLQAPRSMSVATAGLSFEF